jgi:hypothetical protein
VGSGTSDDRNRRRRNHRGAGADGAGRHRHRRPRASDAGTKEREITGLGGLGSPSDEGAASPTLARNWVPQVGHLTSLPRRSSGRRSFRSQPGQETSSGMRLSALNLSPRSMTETIVERVCSRETDDSQDKTEYL